MYYERYPVRHRTLSPPVWAAIGAVAGVSVALATGLLFPVDPRPLARLQCVLYAEPPAEIQPGWQAVPASLKRAEPRPVLVCAPIGGAR